MDRKREIYVHTDVEASGPIPGPFSLWSIGSVAMQADKTIVSYFSANLLDLPGAGRDPQTTEFWRAIRKPMSRLAGTPAIRSKSWRTTPTGSRTCRAAHED